MAKYINNKIKSGRVAGSVFAVRFGDVIERAYNPYVANPKSDAQVEARAKLKLLSQLSAILGDKIAMPRQGAVSTRNLFTRENYSAVTYQNMQADINLTAIKLTKSAVGLPSVVVTRGESAITASLAFKTTDIDRVVYVMVVRDEENELSVLGSAVATAAGAGQDWPASFENTTRTGVILAYGVRDNTEAARVMFGNLEAPTAQQVARIVVTRMLLESDITLTETRGGLLSAM